jgi:hypothetical protein
LAVESCLIQKLPVLFSPADVISFKDATVTALAIEDEESVAERAFTQGKLNILEDGLRALKGVKRYRSLSLRGIKILKTKLRAETYLLMPPRFFYITDSTISERWFRE